MTLTDSFIYIYIYIYIEREREIMMVVVVLSESQPSTSIFKRRRESTSEGLFLRNMSIFQAVISLHYSFYFCFGWLMYV
jgi:hypothetical protein